MKTKFEAKLREREQLKVRRREHCYLDVVLWCVSVHWYPEHHGIIVSILLDIQQHQTQLLLISLQ